ncbi:unnamed protein product [Cyclocybe aegerita]|uniref:DNA2/NAM7 helicase-like C-terminal domain-containing protein n=1 Tax=Cyclocybe aegerita TaxID=1973307 RepID=A0A8S0WYY1_CYCAE|nr:unnamed protein product [Cyclocybe aegerita]
MDTIDQTILRDKTSFPSTLRVRHTSQVRAGDACRHLASGGPIGIAYHIDSQGQIDFIALSNLSLAFVIHFDSPHHNTPHGSAEFAYVLQSGSEEPGTDDVDICLVGFSLSRTAIQVNSVTQRHVRGVDLSTLFCANAREPWSPARIVRERVSSNADSWDIARLWLGEESTAQKDVCLQAWLATCVASKCPREIMAAIKVSTRFLSKSELACLADLVAQSDLLDYYKPKEVVNDFSSGGYNKEGKFEVHNERYKTRVRPSELTRVIMTDEHGREYTGNAKGAKGKRTTIRMHDKSRNIGALSTVKVLGRQEPTNPEKARDELLFLLLTSRKDLRNSAFVRSLWFPSWKDMHEPPDTVDEVYAGSAMVGERSVVVAHGPPGTGKTTTIAAASRIWDLCRFPVWIVAHSNVAVKNIAETLFKKDVDFKLVVSKEFYVEWHEHLYSEIQEKVRRSDELPTDKVAMERELGGSQIVLSTLSMISNPALHDNGTFDIIPVKRLVIDEASQINIFEFMHILVRFQSSLQKVCFFGDPQQLPPFGQDKVSRMKTIFDLQHISCLNQDLFLDTQYRMPVPIGAFISKAVYKGRLLSQHLITHPSCLAFIDVSTPQGFEERAGTSWRNPGEVQTMVHLVRTYYKSTHFCIITPYDAQRAAIQRVLQNESLPWDSVYNLDSFQGNEADFVLVSVVRSSQPGFLVSLQRMNVLLTRCRKGLIVVTNRGFIEYGGSGTLLGLLARHWLSAYNETSWIDWRTVADATANLPGAPARPRQKVDTLRPFSVPGSAFSKASCASNSVPPLRTNLTPKSPNLQNMQAFPPLWQKKTPILPGSWKTSDLSPFSYAFIAQAPRGWPTRISARSIPDPTPYANVEADYWEDDTEKPSLSATVPRQKDGGTIWGARSNEMQKTPGDGTMSTHKYHPHSLLNKRAVPKKEVEKPKLKSAHKPVKSLDTWKSGPAVAHPSNVSSPARTSAPSTSVKSSKTKIVETQQPSKPLGFIRSFVKYS